MTPEPESPQQDPTDSAPEEEGQADVQAAEPTPKAEARATRKPGRKRKAASTAEEADGDAAETPAPAKRPRVRKRAAATASAETEAAQDTESAAAREPVAEEKAPAKRRSAAKAAAEPPAPAAAKRADGAPRRRVVKAHARYVRTSARKARMVCGHLRGKSVQEARAILAFTPREVARDWSKLLESAVANAESNHELLEDDLVVREAYADEGPTIKRFRPRALGRATPIRKRTSHLTITLTPTPEPRGGKRRG
jgi:ribosomal protein L22